MATNDVSLNVVTIAAAQTVPQPAVNAIAGSSGSMENQPQAQLWKPGPGTPSGAGSPDTQLSTDQVKQQVENALKNTGVKAEIEMERGIGMVVRLVDANGKLFMQLPPQAVLDLVEQVESEQAKEASERFGSPTYSGKHIDQVA